MTVALPAEPFSLQASAAWSWLMETAADIARALRRLRPLSASETKIYSAVEDFGAHVLDAADIADLHARLYAVARDPRFLSWEFEMVRQLDFDGLPEHNAVEKTFAKAFGPTHLAIECARLLAARADAVIQARAAISVAALPDGASAVLSESLADFRTPPVLRNLFEETIAGEVALLALLAPIVDAERWPCPPWLRLALMEQVRLASMSHLRLLSGVTGVVIPESVLPLDERIDLHTLELEARELAHHVLPAELPVGEPYAASLRELIDGDSPAPPGVRALFEG
jgi:hypothetical protein